MGDGRYYTYYQFFIIIFFTIISCGLIFTIIHTMVKSRKKQRIYYIIYAGNFLLLYSIGSFIIEVTYEVEWALVLSYISTISILGYFITYIFYYSKRKLFGIGCILGFIAVTKLKFIDSYTFTEIIYTRVYQWSMLALTVCLIIVILKDNINIYKTDNNYKKTESLIKGLSVIAFTFAYLLYIYIPELVYVFYFALIMQVIMLNLIFLKFMPEEKIPIGYYNIIENMIDTLIVLNLKKEILYINDTEISGLVDKNKVVDLRNLVNLLNLQNAQIVLLGNNVIKVNGINNGKTISCKMSLETIMKKNKLVGYVIVIEDGIYLEEMISELREKKKLLIQNKKELLNYSRTSKILSDEKERNKLLLDVQNELGHHFALLTKYIENTIDKIKNKDLCEHELKDDIITSIVLARNNLKKIRETVKEYRETYDGKE